MLKILSIPFTILAYTWFAIFICIFHPIQWICLKAFGYQAHKKSVDVLNFFLEKTTYFLLSYIRFENRELIPTGKPLIIASNHQSLFDIIGMAWFLRKHHLKYVSKIELGKNIPSISFNLRNSGSALIDRKNPKQALPELKKIAEYIQKYNRTAVIYPEGTRTKDGRPKEFAASGLKILCKYAPDAYVVPITINNSWKVNRYGHFPLGMFNKITFTIHPAMSVADNDFKTLFEYTERAIVDSIVVDE